MRGARLVWPVIAACFALLSATLGGWLAVERSERLALVRQLQQTPAGPARLAGPTDAETPEEEPSPSSYLVTRRALDKGLDPLPIPAMVRADPPPPSPPILQVWQRDGLNP